MGTGTKILLLFLFASWQPCFSQDSRTAGARSLSSLVRAFGNTPRSSPFSGRSASGRSLPFSPPPEREPKESPPTLRSRFDPSPQVGKSKFSPASNPKSVPPSKPTRFESDTPSTARPVAHGKSEFRFGSNRSRPSSRITFIPQDRGERFSRRQKTGGLAAKLSSLPVAAPVPAVITTTTRTTTNRPTTTKPPVTKKPNYEYVYDDYYDDEYYYYDEKTPTAEEKKKPQTLNLGPIDPPIKESKPSAPSPQVIQKISSASPTLETASRPGGLSLADRLAGKEPKDTGSSQQSVNEVDFSNANQQLSQQFEPPTPKPPATTTTSSRVEVRVSNTSEKTFVVANIQTSRSMSMREESTLDNTTPFYEEATVKPEETPIEENNSNDIPPRPSLTSLFGNIDVTANEARKGRAEKKIEDISETPEPKIVDITTEAHRLSTTEKTSVSAFLDKIFEEPLQIDASKLPPGFSLENTPAVEKSTTSTTTETTSTTVRSAPTVSKEDILFAKIFGGPLPTAPPPDLLPKGFSATEKAELVKNDQESANNIEKSNASLVTEKTSTLSKEDLILQKLFGKAESATPPSALLPKDFKFSAEPQEETNLPKKFNVPIGKSKPAPASLLPKGFNSPVNTETTEPSVKTTTAIWATSKGPGGLLFPKRNTRPSYLTTTTTKRPEEPTEAPSSKRTYVNLFERVKTTTSPRPTVKSEIRKVVAAAAGVPIPVKPDIPTTPKTTTTTTSTTTTEPPKPTTPGVCGEKCRLFATIRITDGVEWVPELKNRDTKEFQDLARRVKNNLNAIYQRSRLNRWYVGVEIDSFNEGSVMVDYIVQLNDVSTEFDTVDLKHIMNGMLESSNQAEYRLGPFSVDPEGTDFVVIKERQRSVVTDDGSYLIPEWLIAVIVISLASFLFIIIFGILVLVSRARVRKRNVPLTEEVLNKLNANQLAGVNTGYHHDSGYDMNAIWDEKMVSEAHMKPPSSTGRGYNPNYNINIYDSWRTDWSGPYGSSATYAKRRPEANF